MGAVRGSTTKYLSSGATRPRPGAFLKVEGGVCGDHPRQIVVAVAGGDGYPVRLAPRREGPLVSTSWLSCEAAPGASSAGSLPTRAARLTTLPIPRARVAPAERALDRFTLDLGATEDVVHQRCLLLLGVLDEVFHRPISRCRSPSSYLSGNPRRTRCSRVGRKSADQWLVVACPQVLARGRLLPQRNPSQSRGEELARDGTRRARDAVSETERMVLRELIPDDVDDLGRAIGAARPCPPPPRPAPRRSPG